MAKEKPRCVLCGQEISWLDRDSISIYDTEQPACSACQLKFSNASAGEKADMQQQILASPYLMNVEAIRAYQDAVSGKSCPACGADMERKLKDFAIGADGYGGLTSLGLEQYVVDLFACPKCGKVELYTAGFNRKKAAEPPKEVICPDCGTRHSALIGCPTCALRNPQKIMARDSRQSKDRKPPWER